MEPAQSASHSDEWMHDSLIDDEMRSFLGSLSFSQDNPDDIVRRDDGEIEAISISRLIADFTGEKPVQSEILICWLFVYQSYITPLQFLLALRKRFELARRLEGRAGLVITLRTISLLRSWVDKFPRDFQPQHIDLGVYVEAWMHQLSDTRFSKIPHAMLSSLARARAPKNTTLSYLLPTPKSIIPKVEPFALLDLDHLEIARQLSLVDFEVASRIQPKEFLRLAWTKKDKETTSPNILKRIQFTARISLFVHESLLNAVDSELQQIAELWVGVLKHLKTFASLNCVISVFGGFHSLPRAVFQKIMETLSTDNQAIVTDIQALCNPERNWTAARQFIREANPPCLPYFGISLTDLTFLEDGQWRIFGRNLIHFKRLQLVGHTLRDFYQYTQKPYNFEPQLLIQRFLLRDFFDSDS